MNRAAQQLSQLTTTDSTLGMPLSALNLRTCRQRLSTLPSTTPRLNDMGINPREQQPSQSKEYDDNLFDFPPETAQPNSATVEQNNSTTTTAAANQLPFKRTIYVRHVASGQSIVVYCAPEETMSEIGQICSRALNLNPFSYTLLFGTQPIQPGIPLTDQ